MFPRRTDRGMLMTRTTAALGALAFGAVLLVLPGEGSGAYPPPGVFSRVAPGAPAYPEPPRVVRTPSPSPTPRPTPVGTPMANGLVWDRAAGTWFDPKTRQWWRSGAGWAP